MARIPLAIVLACSAALARQGPDVTWTQAGGRDGATLRFAEAATPDGGQGSAVAFALVSGDAARIEAEVKRLAGPELLGPDWIVVATPDPARDFEQVCAAVLSREGLDGARVHVIGWGEGARDALRTAARSPERVASVTAIAPAPLDEADLGRVGALVATPVALIHGSRDAREPMLSVLELLLEAGSDAVTIDYESGAERATPETCRAVLRGRMARARSRERERAGAESAVRAVLDEFHLAASKADGERYFACLAPDAIFVGTDATERWDVARFREFCEPYFREGRGWTYVAGERHVALSREGKLAWFDERLSNDKYGAVRGSGVVRLDGGRWRIVQYVMSFPIPNELSGEVVRRIRELGR